MPSHLTFPFDQALGGDSAAGHDAILADQFGVDIMFRGKLIVGPDADYQLVRGIANLRASIYRRLYTAKGSYKANPLYGVGLPGYLKKKLTGSVLSSIEHDIRTQLTRDKRITAIKTLILDQFTDASGGQGLRVTLAVVAFGRTVKFTPFAFQEVR